MGRLSLLIAVLIMKSNYSIETINNLALMCQGFYRCGAKGNTAYAVSTACNNASKQIAMGIIEYQYGDDLKKVLANILAVSKEFHV